MFVIYAISWYKHLNFSTSNKDNHEDERINADGIHQSQGSLSFMIILCTNIPLAFFPKKNPTPTKNHAMAFTFLPAYTND
jgi:hypothetical protein